MFNLQQHVIEAKIVTGPNHGAVVWLPRITMRPSDSHLPFTLERRQFPLQLTWVMTLNKAQGQTLRRAGS